MKKKVRTIFISDTHLGSSFCQSKKLLEFLKEYKTENLYLVGDFIDGWKLKKDFKWADDYSFILRRIIGMMKKDDTAVNYVIGNHDEFLRKFIPNSFGALHFDNEFTHITAKGEKILVIHGDIFDTFTKNVKFLYFLGDHAYTIALYSNKITNFVRDLMGWEYWSLSSFLKSKVKNAVGFINNFEDTMTKYTIEKKCSGIICGHIHHPKISEINGVKYFNCGDWVESCTALIEDFDGNITLMSYK